MEKELRVKIPGGTLVASKMPDPNNPGIVVEFEPDDGYSNHSVLMEHNEEKGLRALVWADEWQEEPTHDINLR